MVKLTVLVCAVLLAAAQLPPIDFNYMKGGDDWPGLCQTGYYQSPVHIHNEKAAPDYFGALKIDYQETPAHKYTINWDNGFSLLGLSGQLKTKTVGNENEKTFYGGAIQIHSPSEHKVEGAQADLEIQIVHVGTLDPTKVANANHAVVSVLVDEKDGANNHFLQQIINADTAIDVNDLFEGETISDYYAYQGSATTPPCTENIHWFVVAEVQYASAAQLEFFKRKWEMDPAFAGGHGNNRNVQYGTTLDIFHYHDYAAGLALSVLLVFASIFG